MDKSALHRAVEHVGGQSALAKRLTVHTGHPYRQGHVWKWLHRDKAVPAEVCVPIELLTEGMVKRHELRPDVFPADEAAA